MQTADLVASPRIRNYLGLRCQYRRLHRVLPIRREHAVVFSRWLQIACFLEVQLRDIPVYLQVVTFHPSTTSDLEYI